MGFESPFEWYILWHILCKKNQKIYPNINLELLAKSWNPETELCLKVFVISELLL
jgi:hypothetical protein